MWWWYHKWINGFQNEWRSYEFWNSLNAKWIWKLNQLCKKDKSRKSFDFKYIFVHFFSKPNSNLSQLHIIIGLLDRINYFFCSNLHINSSFVLPWASNFHSATINKLKRIFLDFEAPIFPDSAFQSFSPEFSQKGQILVISWPLIILATMVDSKWHQSWTEFCITILSSFFVCCSSWTEGWHCDILKYFCIWMVILFVAFIFVLISIWSSTVHTRHVSHKSPTR